MITRQNRGEVAKRALLASALLLGLACAPHETAVPETTAGQLEVDLALAERREIPQLIEVFGTVEAAQTAAVSARVMAQVTAVRVQPGDVVRRGQLLLEIDPQTARGQQAQAEGAAAQARAGLALARRNLERFEALAAVDAASELELDLARMQYEQASGAVEQAQGAVAAAAAVAGDSRVVAPFPGRVVRKMVEVGDLAAPGRPLLMLESEGEPRLALTVPESVMADVHLLVGDPLPIRLDGRSGLGTFEARIVEVSSGADPLSHSFQIKVGLPAGNFPSGSSGRAWIQTDRRMVVSVPEAAVVRRGGLSLVVTRNAEGRAQSRVVTLGERLADRRIEVLSGLNGDETVASGLSSVPPSGTHLQGTAPTPKEPS